MVNEGSRPLSSTQSAGQEGTDKGLQFQVGCAHVGTVDKHTNI